MKKIELKAEQRTQKGKKAKKLLKEGMIPAVMYGKHLEDNYVLSIDKLEFDRIIKNPEWESHIYELSVEGEKHEVIIKKIVFDSYKRYVEHIDLFQITRGEKIEINIPVQLNGEAEGVKKGGVLEHYVKEIHVKCLPQDIPEHVTVDITDLDVGSYIKLKDIKFPENVEVLSSPDETVVMVGVPSTLKGKAEEEEIVEEQETTEEEIKEEKKEEKKGEKKWEKRGEKRGEKRD